MPTLPTTDHLAAVRDGILSEGRAAQAPIDLDTVLRCAHRVWHRVETKGTAAHLAWFNLAAACLAILGTVEPDAKPGDETSRAALADFACEGLPKADDQTERLTCIANLALTELACRELAELHDLAARCGFALTGGGN